MGNDGTEDRTAWTDVQAIGLLLVTYVDGMQRLCIADGTAPAVIRPVRRPTIITNRAVPSSVTSSFTMTEKF